MSERVRKKSEQEGKINRDKEVDVDLMTITNFGMPNRRGDAAEKHSLRLQIIAPKDDVYGTSSNPAATRINSANLNVPPRVRLPPRSRTGCWSVQSHPQTIFIPRVRFMSFISFAPIRHDIP